jgi:hypothetical protein
MSVKTGQAWAGLFVTLDATGALAAGTPAGTLYVDGTSDAAEVTITGSNPYKYAVTLPTLTAGQRVDMYITATISTIATAAIVASEQADTSLVSDVKTDTAAILLDTGTDGVIVASGTVTTLSNLPAIPNDWLTAAGIKEDAITEIQSGLATPTNITAGTITTVTSVTNGVTLADDAITAAKFDETTAFPTKSADTGATALARVGADSDTLETLSDQMDAIKTETASILEDTGTTLDDLIDDLETRLTAARAGYLDKLNVSGTLAHSDAAATYQADVSALALEATLTAIKGAGWIDETLAALMTAIEAIETGSGGGATADEIWDELLSGHTSAGSAGKALSDILTDTGTDIPALIAALSAWQASAVTSAVSSGTITDVRGSSWSIAIEDLTLDSNKQQFAIKRNAGDLDAQALLLVDSATGLLTLNGVSSGLTAGDASLVYAGTTLTLTVKPNITAQIPSGAWKYGIQYVTAAGVVEEPYGGTFTVQADVVRAAS